MKEKTIAAISTPVGVGGIAVIRISGNDAIEIAAKIFKGKDDILNVATHTVHYGHIVDEGEVIDEVLVTVMKAPRSFTGEDVVEIGTHGGVVASKMVLKTLIKNGAYPAGPGEFTKRAFLNGKIDLSEAEGVIDIINAKNEVAEKNAVGQASGRMRRWAIGPGLPWTKRKPTSGSFMRAERRSWLWIFPVLTPCLPLLPRRALPVPMCGRSSRM